MGRTWRRTFRTILGANLTSINVPDATIPPAMIFSRPAPTAPFMEIGPTSNGKTRRRAFTLVELILVMTIMVMLIGLVFPSLKGFFRGRNLDNEALRFLALTRFGQSRAVNEGVPVELWVNSQAGTYGLEALSGYTETQT